MTNTERRIQKLKAHFSNTLIETKNASLSTMAVTEFAP